MNNQNYFIHTKPNKQSSTAALIIVMSANDIMQEDETTMESAGLIYTPASQ